MQSTTDTPRPAEDSKPDARLAPLFRQLPTTLPKLNPPQESSCDPEPQEDKEA